MNVRKAVLSLLLVSLVVTGGMTTNVAADEWQPDWAEEMIWALDHAPEGSVSSVGWNIVDSAMDYLHGQEDDGDDSTHVDLYDGLAGQEIQFENLRKTFDSYSNDTQTTAFVKAENVTISEIEAGSSESTVNSSARNAVFDYYTASQVSRYFDGVEIATEQLDYVVERANQSDGIHPQDVASLKAENLSTSVGSNQHVESSEYLGKSEVERTLPNGTTQNVSVQEWRIEISVSYNSDTWYRNETVTIDPLNGPVHMDSGGSGWSYTAASDGSNTDIVTELDVVAVQAVPPSGSNLDTIEYMPLAEMEQTWQSQKDSANMIADNAGQYAVKLHQADQNGTLDAANYTSPYVLAQEYASDYNSTGYWTYAVAMLSATGTATPDLNTTGMMTVHYQGNEYTGLVMASKFPNGTLETDVTYDGSNTEAFGERAWLVTDSGKRIILDSTFTITEMEDKEGNTINRTKEVKYVYQGVNLTEYKNLQEQVLELQQELEEREPAAGGGSGSSGWNQDQLIIGIAAIAGLALLAQGKD